jgi:proteic killer suppression protein
VKVRSFLHKSLRKLYADDVTKGVPPEAVDKLRKMLAFLDEMEDVTGDRKGMWSLSVTANRRLTFRVDADEREIFHVNLEDYH